MNPDHRMKMLIKLVNRKVSPLRIERAIRAHKKTVGDVDAPEEPERIAKTERRAI
jgi:hypothetical protein